MFSFAKGVKLLDHAWPVDPSGTAPSWNTRVQFDASLVPRLVAQHDELNTHFASIAGQLGKDPKTAERAVRECASRLHELRRIEALSLYPLIACEFAPDAAARPLTSHLRLAMVRLARRVMRSLDELASAIHSGIGIPLAVDRVASALREYRLRNEGEIYPMYDRTGRRSAASATHSV